MKKKEKIFLENLIKKYSKKKLSHKPSYSLLENAFSLDVPLVVDMGIGTNWLEAH